MRIKTQLLISIIVFSVILVIIGSSVALTQLQITQLNSQEALTRDIQTGASNLNYISNNYFLYQSSSSIDLWQTEFSTLSAELAQLNSTNTQQQTLVNTVNYDMVNLNSVFGGVTTFLNNAPRNVSIRVLPNFQTQWNRMAVQIQALSFDAQQLSQNIQDQTSQAVIANTIFTVALLGTFAAFFIAIYFVSYRRTLRSIDKLKKDIGIIGSGNLDHTIDAGRKDEIADISESVNHMATNLKDVTASKADLEEAQASLRESEQRWATTLASIGDAVISTDTFGKIMFMNKEAEALTGWQLGEASQKTVKTVFNIINEQTRLEVENPIERVLREGIVVGLANHTVLIRKDSEEVPIDDSGAPIRNKEGKITGVVLIFRDITERKKAEEALLKAKDQTELDKKRLETIFETTPAAVVVLEAPSGKISYINKRAIQLYGFNTVGLDLDAALRKIKPKKADGSPYPLESGPTRRALNGYETINEEMIIERVDGTKFPILTSASPVRDNQGKVTAAIVIFQDITERKEAEGKLEEYRNNLERLVEERTKQLKDSERLATIGATAGMVGHDIRNPLQAITSDLYLAKTELDTLPENEQKTNALESLNEIEHNIDYINKIVADLQDYARPLNPRAQETNIKTIFNEILAKNGVPKNIKVTVDVEDKAQKVMADPDYLKRIAANLILNAVQAMPKGGKLTIHAYSEKVTNDVLIMVKDTGIGIPEDIKPKLFTPMMTTKSKGQGFGLAVVKRMTEGLGGTVNFESTEGKGTTFIVRLPPDVSRLMGNVGTLQFPKS